MGPYLACFIGVVIVTTNLFENYDPALLRRIQRHIHFCLPNASMRRELFTLHLPNPERLTADYAILASLSRGLSGGDILNICVNAIYAGSVDPDSANWAVSQGMLEREIAKVKKAKAEHSGEKAGSSCPEHGVGKGLRGPAEIDEFRHQRLGDVFVLANFHLIHGEHIAVLAARGVCQRHGLQTIFCQRKQQLWRETCESSLRLYPTKDISDCCWRSIAVMIAARARLRSFRSR